MKGRCPFCTNRSHSILLPITLPLLPAALPAGSVNRMASDGEKLDALITLVAGLVSRMGRLEARLDKVHREVAGVANRLELHWSTTITSSSSSCSASGDGDTRTPRKGIRLFCSSSFFFLFYFHTMMAFDTLHRTLRPTTLPPYSQHGPGRRRELIGSPTSFSGGSHGRVGCLGIRVRDVCRCR